MFVGSNRTDEIQTAHASEPSRIITIRIKDPGKRSRIRNRIKNKESET